MTGTQVERVTVPVAKNPDGSSITGPYTFTIADLGAGSPISADGSTATIYAGLNNPSIPYPPATTDTTQAELTSYATYTFNTARADRSSPRRERRLGLRRLHRDAVPRRGRAAPGSACAAASTSRASTGSSIA